MKIPQFTIVSRLLISFTLVIVIFSGVVGYSHITFRHVDALRCHQIEYIESRTAQQFKHSDVEFEIEERLKSLRKEKPFAGIHICSKNSNDVPDEPTARLVVLSPMYDYKKSPQETLAMKEINNIFNNRGTSQRIYRNMLVFIAPDQDFMGQLKKSVRSDISYTRELKMFQFTSIVCL